MKKDGRHAFEAADVVASPIAALEMEPLVVAGGRGGGLVPDCGGGGGGVVAKEREKGKSVLPRLFCLAIKSGALMREERCQSHASFLWFMWVG